VSAYRRYRIQVTSPADVLDPATGRIVRGRPIVAQFEDWNYWNDAKDPGVKRLTDEALQSNPRCGLQSDFWLASEQKEKAQAKRLADARRTLHALPPEVLAEFVAELSLGQDADHKLPTPPAK